VASLSSSPARRIAVYGRQKWKWYVASKHAMPLSIIAKFTNASTRADCQGLRPRCSTSVRAISFQMANGSNQKNAVLV
jgi:hypothetical protein